MSLVGLNPDLPILILKFQLKGSIETVLRLVNSILQNKCYPISLKKAMNLVQS